MDDIQHEPPTPGCVGVVMPAAGSGRRFGSAENKLFAELAGRPIWYRSAQRLRTSVLVGRIVMPVSVGDHLRFESEFANQVRELQIELVVGGAERTDSVQMGLNRLMDDDRIRLVAVHDAARPLVATRDLEAVFANAWQTGAAILATPMSGTVKRQLVDGTTTVDRKDLWTALTPQVFRKQLLGDAYRRYRGRPATDDAELVERMGHPVSLVKGSADNLKITHPEDLLIATAILNQQESDV